MAIVVVIAPAVDVVIIALRIIVPAICAKSEERFILIASNINFLQHLHNV